MSSKLCAVLKEFRQVAEADLVEVGGVIQNFPYKIHAFHDYEKTPDALPSLLTKMRKTSADLYKIAVYARSSLDLLRLLELSLNNPDLIAVSMGEIGSPSRVLAPVFGSPLMYAPLSLEEANAPGQIPLSDLVSIYGFRRLNPNTQIFALLGNPVAHSIGHLFHNEIFQKEKQNAVYVKIPVTKEEIGPFLAQAKYLKFCGFSITMPLKEAVLPFLDHIDDEARQIGAVNTVVLQDGKHHGFNTDGKAALDALGDVQRKKITLLGKGGAARAIAFEAQKRGGVIVQQGYDILINCTPNPMPISSDKIIPNTAVMDLSLKETTLLHEARAKGCSVLNGHPMYVKQALMQQSLWNCLVKLPMQL